MHDRLRCAGLTTAALLAALAAPAARAALGGDLASVSRDHDALQATHVIRPGVSYDVHEGVTPAGLRLREYADRGGRVFAVTWRGTTTPDVSMLLGDYAARYQQAARAHRGGHHVLTINAADLAVTIVRLPRGWQGVALLPQQLPTGVNRAELR